LAYKCTLERIKRIGGEVIPGAAEEVDESDVNGIGVYVPPEPDKRKEVT
jgi:hypothetical protein